MDALFQRAAVPGRLKPSFSDIRYGPAGLGHSTGLRVKRRKIKNQGALPKPDWQIWLAQNGKPEAGTLLKQSYLTPPAPALRIPMLDRSTAALLFKLICPRLRLRIHGLAAYLLNWVRFKESAWIKPGCPRMSATRTPFSKGQPAWLQHTTHPNALRRTGKSA